MKIIDTTTYFEEDLMMDLRFNILDPFIDKFIVCEARFSHSGKKKEIKFNKKNFPKFEDKIIHAIIDNEPANLIIKNNLSNSEIRMNSVLRIQHQRNFISNFIDKFSPEDYLIHSDNDEIPNLEAYNLKNNKKKFVIFKQKMFYYKFNLGLPNLNWHGSKACKIKDLKSIDFLRSIKNKSYPFYRIDILLSDIKHHSVKIVENGGWHFSNLKNLEELERKYLNDENYAEYLLQGYSKEMIKENLTNKSISYNHSAKKNSNDRFQSTKLEKIELDNLPAYLLKNLKLYEDWLD
jgi:beta-1,4-mannosyl-glycoprotein beta-1,4-N-acetylglucosaminyltransferase